MIATDALVRGTLCGGTLRFVTARVTQVARKLASQHGLAPGPARVLGEAIAATAMLAAPIKAEDEKYSLALHGEGALASVHVDINFGGDVRGYLRLRDDAAAAQSPDALMSSPGQVRITRARPGKVLYQAITAMRLGSIATDLAFHASMSDQIESELCIFDGGGHDADTMMIAGLLVQALPGAGVEDFVPLRERLHGRTAIRPTAEDLDRPARLADVLLGPFNPQILEVAPVQMRCNCSRERVEAIFEQLEPAQLHDLLMPDGSAFADCQWCGTKYVFSPEEMNQYLLRVDPNARSH
jgi:molecular chaperone Hsp33